MQKLVKGIHDFQRGYFSERKALFERLATQGQAPETLFITCSDSRLMPERITGADPGEMFTVRNVGNVVPHPTLPGGTSAALEFAVCELRVRHIVVCGHTQCGAIQAILEPEKLATLRYVKPWLTQAEGVKRIIEEKYAHLSGDELLTAAVEENVLAQLEHLREYDFVAERLDAGTLHLGGWVAHLGRGEVFEYDPEQGEFVPVAGE